MTDPHGDQPVETTGATVTEAEAAVVCLHGRGATATGMLDFAAVFDVDGVAYLAPQAAQRTWYPESFLRPVEANEPGRTSGLEKVGAILDDVAAAGIDAERTLLLGFSQGACLACEFVARTPQCYGGLAALSGGLIGDTVDRATFQGSLEGTPAFLGCSDVDPHIPVERVETTAAVLEDLGAEVEVRLYEGMGHGVNEEEQAYVRGMVEDLAESAA
jgi:phospholipase/carboxylesterase